MGDQAQKAAHGRAILAEQGTGSREQVAAQTYGISIQWVFGEGGVGISKHIDIPRDFRGRFPLSGRRGGWGVRKMAGTMTKGPTYGRMEDHGFVFIQPHL
jgi:hypothetical protein